MATTEQIAKQYYNKGMQCIFSNNIEIGIDNLNMALSIYEELGDDVNYIMAMHGLAVGYGAIGYDSKMLSKCLNGIQYLDKKSIKGAKHYFYSTICARYIDLKDYDSSLIYARLALQDLEDYGPNFPNHPFTYLVIYLSLAYIYTHINKLEDAVRYLKRSKEIAIKNDLHQHDFAIAILDANLHMKQGDTNFIYDHMDELLGFVKAIDITIQDYIKDITLLIETLCAMNEFDHAIGIVKSLDYAAQNNNDYPLEIESAKLYMYIYKLQNNIESYHDACVKYAENSIAFEEYKAEKRIVDMDTSIALSIADTPIDLI